MLTGMGTGFSDHWLGIGFLGHEAGTGFVVSTGFLGWVISLGVAVNADGVENIFLSCCLNTFLQLLACLALASILIHQLSDLSYFIIGQNDPLVFNFGFKKDAPSKSFKSF